MTGFFLGVLVGLWLARLAAAARRWRDCNRYEAAVERRRNRDMAARP